MEFRLRFLPRRGYTSIKDKCSEVRLLGINEESEVSGIGHVNYYEPDLRISIRDPITLNILLQACASAAKFTAAVHIRTLEQEVSRFTP